MMRFVDQQPMRAPRSGPQRGDVWQELAKKRWPFRYGQSLGVDNDIHYKLAQQLECLFDPRGSGRIADRSRMLEFVVIALRIEYTELELPLDHALCERGGQGRFSDS